MKKICILIPYFGKLPNNMYTFLISCKKNPSIDWIIFTNDDISKYNSYCSNVSFVRSNLNQIKNRIKEILHTKAIVLDKPYKLCDYRPLYGLIFSKYLKYYDYWGYSDLDVVYGNLRKYINNGIVNNYLKIGKYGHFTLFKNTNYVNNLYKLPIFKYGKKIFLFNNYVSQTSKACHFDEYKGINIICKQNNILTYTNSYLVNEVSFQNLDLNTRDSRYQSKNSCYIWNKGKALYFYKKNGKIYKHEYGYFHFQKRHAFRLYINTPKRKINTFSITTYGYKPLNSLNKSSIICAMDRNRSSFIKRVNYIIKWYICSDYLFHVNIKNVCKRLFIYHNFHF